MSMDRRQFLLRSGTLGCSLAASPLVTPMTFASAPWDARLVVLILRGGMDGLDVLRPYGDAGLAPARRRLARGDIAAQDLDGFYALHPELAALRPLWDKGELAFAHAVSTPYRGRRSHFDGQDLLEAGTGFDVEPVQVTDGWLNRLLQVVPGTSAKTAFAIGREELLVLAGQSKVSRWSPEADLDLTPHTQRLLEMIYHDDPLFRDAAGQAFQIAEQLQLGGGADSFAEMLNGMQSQMKTDTRGQEHKTMAKFAARLLSDDTRIAAFSLNGWDTHRGQRGAISYPLKQLVETLQTLREGLGPVWQKTAVVAMTEFGRTVRENGTNGTDHGTGGAMLMAGGAIRGGKVYGQWPGLDEASLYARRDLMPTEDVRAYAARMMQGLFGLDRAVLESSVFPGLDMGSAPRVIA